MQFSAFPYEGEFKVGCVDVGDVRARVFFFVCGGALKMPQEGDNEKDID